MNSYQKSMMAACKSEADRFSTLAALGFAGLLLASYFAPDCGHSDRAALSSVLGWFALAVSHMTSSHACALAISCDWEDANKVRKFRRFSRAVGWANGGTLGLFFAAALDLYLALRVDA